MKASRRETRRLDLIFRVFLVLITALWLTPGRAQDLARQEQAGDGVRHQGLADLPRVHEVVFHRVPGARDLGALQTGDGTDVCDLHVQRQAGGQAAGVDLVRVQALRLDEDLVAFVVGEADDLVLDRRAVARPAPRDAAGVQRGAVQVRADHRERRRRGPRDVARHARQGRADGSPRAERPGRGVARLDLHLVEVHGRLSYSRGGPGLQPTDGQAHASQRVGLRKPVLSPPPRGATKSSTRSRKCWKATRPRTTACAGP